VLSVTLSTALYILVGFAATALVPWRELAVSDAPLALAASEALGGAAFDVLAIVAMLTTLNTCLVLMIVSSRIVYGMSREGVLPAALGRVSRKTGSPYVAVVLVLAAALCFLALGSMSAIAKVTSFGSLLTFALVNLAMLHLRRVAPDMHRPFRAPLSVGWLSVTGLVGLVSCLAMLTRFDWVSVLLGLVLPVSGVAVFWLYGRRQPSAEAEPLHQPHERSDWAIRRTP
jgi:APA family basic amino acid/polyamine antiporter